MPKSATGGSGEREREVGSVADVVDAEGEELVFVETTRAWEGCRMADLVEDVVFRRRRSSSHRSHALPAWWKQTDSCTDNLWECGCRSSNDRSTECCLKEIWHQ